MKSINKASTILATVALIITVSNCASSQKLQDKAPLQIGGVYYQNWVAGVEGGGSGVNLFIPVISNKNNIKLDSVYFQGNVVKLEFKKDNLVVGRFLRPDNQKRDLIMSNEPYAEYGNKIPELTKKIPFNLNENQCVISYKEGNKIKYFKIDNIREKELLAYPSAPNNKE